MVCTCMYTKLYMCGIEKSQCVSTHYECACVRKRNVLPPRAKSISMSRIEHREAGMGVDAMLRWFEKTGREEIGKRKRVEIIDEKSWLIFLQKILFVPFVTFYIV